MRLLLLIPVFVLMIISGYNLINDISEATNIAFVVLHFIVLLICFLCLYIIIKSIYIFQSIETNEQQDNTSDLTDMELLQF